MMPNIDPRVEARKKRARVVVFISACAATASAAVSGSRFNAWHWLPWIVGMAAIIIFTAISMAASGYRFGGRGRGSGLSAHGRDGDDGPLGTATYRWPVLVAMSRMMPRSAGRRWLAEAESLLSEIPAAKRAAAIRSYLLSAPRLAVMMWTRQALRWARPGPRRPG
jgi:hypothetical protein